jgi:hypothetical protein
MTEHDCIEVWCAIAYAHGCWTPYVNSAWARWIDVAVVKLAEAGRVGLVGAAELLEGIIRAAL